MPSQPIHLVCSSGGVKCFSYIGAIQKLVESGITIASVSTCSMGSVIGSLLACGKTPAEMEEIITEFDFTILSQNKWLSWFRMLMNPYSERNQPNFEEIITKLLGKDFKLEELHIPFSAAALDIANGAFLVYSSTVNHDMTVSEIIRIATAIPPLNKPYERGRVTLVDAVVASQSPVWMAADYEGNYPIVVLKPEKTHNERYRDHFFDFVFQLFAASAQSHDRFNSDKLSRVIEIKINCGNVATNDFSLSKQQRKSLIELGYNAAADKLREYQGDFYSFLKVEDLNAQIDPTYDHTIGAINTARLIMSKYNTEISKRDQVFISYSHKNIVWLNRLQTHMKPIQKFTGIKIWSDKAIKPGDLWERGIENALKTTKVAILLVSKDFLASDYILDKELSYFLNLFQKENILILWVAIDYTTYKNTPLNYIQCLNDPEKPMNYLPESEQELMLIKICDEMEKAMDK